MACTGLRPDGSRPEMGTRSATDLMYIADSLEEQEMGHEAGSSSAGPSGVSSAEPANALPRRATTEADTIEGMIEEEIAIQQEREGQRNAKRQKILEDIEKQEKETQEEEAREAAEDEARWQEHVSTQLQQDEDDIMRAEMNKQGGKRKVTMEVIMRTASGKVVSQSTEAAVVNAGDKVSVQFEFLPDEAILDNEDLVVEKEDHKR